MIAGQNTTGDYIGIILLAALGIIFITSLAFAWIKNKIKW